MPDLLIHAEIAEITYRNEVISFPMQKGEDMLERVVIKAKAKLKPNTTINL